VQSSGQLFMFGLPQLGDVGNTGLQGVSQLSGPGNIQSHQQAAAAGLPAGKRENGELKPLVISAPVNESHLSLLNASF